MDLESGNPESAVAALLGIGNDGNSGGNSSSNTPSAQKGTSGNEGKSKVKSSHRTGAAQNNRSEDVTYQFELVEQPRSKQRKAYVSESRYLSPKPFVLTLMGMSYSFSTRALLKSSFCRFRRCKEDCYWYCVCFSRRYEWGVFGGSNTVVFTGDNFYDVAGRNRRICHTMLVVSRRTSDKVALYYSIFGMDEFLV